MDPANEWFLFLEKNPHFFEICKGDFFISILEAIEKSPQTIAGLKKRFPEIDEKDLEDIMGLLREMEIVAVSDNPLGLFFSLGQQGKKLLFAYRKTKKFYST